MRAAGIRPLPALYCRLPPGLPRGTPHGRDGKNVAEATHPQRRTVYYTGHVQGVGFRYTARRIAGRFLVAGYVQNLDDGRVLLEAEGSVGELDQFLAAVARELGRHVADVSQSAGPASGEFDAFDIRYA